jgi:hypothetical protein
MKIVNINGEYSCVNDRIIMNDIVNIIYDKLVHVALNISVDGTVDEYIFCKNPLDSMENNAKKNIKYITTTVLDCDLILYVNIHPINTINKKATAISGKYVIYGDVKIALKSTDKLFTSINKELFKKILRVSQDVLSKRELSNKEKGNIVIKNKFCILEERYNSKIVCCATCGKIENIKLCHGCYRTGYCSKECLIKNWPKHKYGCLHNTKPLHLCLKNN